ncbi:hypothetical protein [Vibrio parahaemolyticus]|uniref:hypothetical protein n=1 Tax=Vibrio parahaemolyticus TaxID=670 RepID=UPI0011122103|nr:hypothetical protein [Vibrio parahaemolyticus]MBD6947018.1 hypothetical protein [Vibrio parahaemolyticus]MBD6957046.1 hypothetical protein [Vibrio parahaemolyticus]MBD6978084.1 hypothetical protein [Vibrio parahaemolyticus]MCS0033337.1 hypothetical protein [Vibrio parahaemolyticus]WOZ58697.1 hypothetical protein RHS38_12800 [Vibrio parahaemolyticus]
MCWWAFVFIHSATLWLETKENVLFLFNSDAILMSKALIIIGMIVTCTSDFLSICWVSANSEIEPFFGFSDFMSALALIFVMYTVTDYRYKIKVNIYKVNLQLIAYLSMILVGLGLLIGEVWINSSLPVPTWFPSYNFWQATLSLYFVSIVFWWVKVAFIGKSSYTIRNHLKVLKEYKSILTGRDVNLKSIAINELEDIIQDIILSTDRRVILDDKSIRTRAFERQQRIIKSLNSLRTKRILGKVFNVIININNSSMDTYIKKHREKRESSFEIIRLLSSNESSILLSESSSALLNSIMNALSSLNTYERHIVPKFFKQLSNALIENSHSHLHSSNHPIYLPIELDTSSVHFMIYSNHKMIESFSLAGSCPFDVDLFTRRDLSVESYRKFCESVVYAFLSRQNDKNFDFKIPSFLIHSHNTIKHHLYNRASKSQGESFEDIFSSDFYNHLLITANFVNGLCSLSQLNRKPRIIDVKRLNKKNNELFNFMSNVCYDYILVALSIESTKEGAIHLQHSCITLDTLQPPNNNQVINSFDFISRLVQRKLYYKVRQLTKGYDRDGILIARFFLNICLQSQDRHSLSGLNGNFVALGKSIIIWYKNNFSSIWENNPKLATKLIPDEFEYDSDTKVIYKMLIDDKDQVVGSNSLEVY